MNRIYPTAPSVRPPAVAVRRATVLLAATLAVALWTGCASAPRVAIDWRGGPFFTPTNFIGPDALPLDVRRVVVLPAAGLDGFPPESTEGVRAALPAAVTRAGRFEAIEVSAARWTAITGRASVASTDALAPEWFEALEREYGADAVLFTDVTEFRAYAPLALGVRCKLARLAGDRSVVWSFDTVFDLRNPSVANSAKRHGAQVGSGLPADSSPLAPQSPRRFAAYVFDAVFATLPARKSSLKRP